MPRAAQIANVEDIAIAKQKRILVAKVLGKEMIKALKGTSLSSTRQQIALCKISPKVRDFFMKTALAGQKVSAAAYCELRGRSRDNPLLAAAAKATEEEILEFLETISDFDGHQAKHIWSTAERNSIQWG